ncbi:MAG TPA: ABC transporter ATP-binding protein/permease, partial [Chloroflexota bacterium]|nr:ABC transporter ATP-binding protein/permease [Chloroflexota bacterium]
MAERAPPRPALAPAGWAATWRGFRTAIGFAFRADPWLCAAEFGREALNSVLDICAAYAVKLLVDAALARSVEGVLFAAGAIAASEMVERLLRHRFLSSAVMLQEKTELLLDQRLMALAGATPGLEHHERPDYVDELTLLRNDRRYLWSVPYAAGLTLRVTVQLVGQAALLAALHPLLLLLPLSGLPALLLNRHAMRLMVRTRQAGTERARTIRHFFDCTTSATAGMEARTFGLATELLGRHRRLSQEEVRDLDRAEWHGVVCDVLGQTCFAAGYVGAIALVLWRAMHGQATAGDVALTAILARQVNASVAEALRRSRFLQDALRLTRRYLWLTDYGTAAQARVRHPSPAPVPERLAHGITLQDISFRYPETEQDILCGLSVHLPVGAVVALVGENGAGKSTLVKLLCRLYEPTAGRILVDGVDLRRLDLEAWRARLSAAFQDVARFEFLVR